MDKVEFAANTNSYITDYIKFADVKAGVLLTVSGLLTGGLGKLSLSLFDLLKSQDNCWYSVIAIVTMLCVGLGLFGTLWMSFKTLNPSLSEAENSLHSFPDIAERSCEDYTRSSLELSYDEIVSHFCTHNWTLSYIANTKFKSLQCAISWLRLAIIAAFIWGVLYVFLSLTVKESAKCHHDVKTYSRTTVSAIYP